MGNVKTETMRQIIFILTMFYFCNYSFAQTDECQIGTDSAKADYSKGILRTYVFGLTNSFTFGKLLKDEYGIEAVYWSCIVDEQWDCYSKFMDEKIKTKYGDDIFEKVAKKSQQLDSLGKGDRQSAFPGGEMELMKFVYCNLNLDKANYSENKKGRVYLQFAIDTTGRPVDIKVMKTPNEDYSQEAIRIINLMPNWTTATQNGKTIKQQWNLPIVFDNVWKQKHCP
ncbi:hypothetical protein C7N43_36880 [Sphingobacteriales bacterium UPWRP_1]|nr:hypothetical protein B6N25_00505 [Sphingobacteriales bacterium TSM_CSS]PSJ71926.1 hypothetical protein C7N43_36880 [Sphingobacteriales bacterium UPWRP_1]